MGENMEIVGDQDSGRQGSKFVWAADSGRRGFASGSASSAETWNVAKFLEWIRANLEGLDG